MVAFFLFRLCLSRVFFSARIAVKQKQNVLGKPELHNKLHSSVKFPVTPLPSFRCSRNCARGIKTFYVRVVQ